MWQIPPTWDASWRHLLRAAGLRGVHEDELREGWIVAYRQQKRRGRKMQKWAFGNVLEEDRGDISRPEARPVLAQR